MNKNLKVNIVDRLFKLLGWTKWTRIEDCPQDRIFIAILTLDNKIRMWPVYVHMDNNFLAWRDIRTPNGRSIGKWRVKYYKNIKE